MADDAHTTLGRTFAIPADPNMLTAMGRALYNFLYLEEVLTAVMHYAGAADLSITRGKMAYEKEQALEQLAGGYRTASNGGDAADQLDAAATAFGEVRTRVRNELLHAHPQAQGLGYTARDGQSWKTIARTPEEVLDLAGQIEDARMLMEDARVAVRGLKVSRLTP